MLKGVVALALAALVFGMFLWRMPILQVSALCSNLALNAAMLIQLPRCCPALNC